ncbi:unnamed protein product [Chilo suppressalis]|uniref:Alpha-mannosidase n=1 Tax=Chilo suppressalis TaxID=168631 RepID=A0ABN8L9Q1_CHISP|nr:unnamed protein product [Chilo suppressalis]
MALKLLVLLIIASSALSVPTHGKQKAAKCGYESCTKPKDGMLNVHIVAHTHDDVGWLKTVDQYYYGHRNNIQKAGVQYILDSVVKELWEIPERRFIYVETAFFAKWWFEQTPEIHRKVDQLVQEGRLKFAGGAWSMNDEANTYYQSTIDQFTFGLGFLNATFGECGRPRVGWQIDPFGHSREFASLLAGMGYDGLFLGRIDYQDKTQRMKDKTMEFVWRGDDSLGKSSDIFTGILYNTYAPPPGFCFDILCNDEPIIDDPSSPDYNVDRRVDGFFARAKQMARAYSTNNVLVTMGDDFNYQDAGMWFKNLDKLIKYGNKMAADDNLNINIFYSTPDCYLKAVKDANPVLPIKQDDFFPYASDPHSYWTGYFTSRPTIKLIEAEANKYMQMAKQLYVLAGLSMNKMPVLDELKSAMGFLQHHDAITGTEKQHVTYDYIRIISAALHEAHEEITTEALNKLIHGSSSDVKWKFDRCQFNESSCVTSENARGAMIVTVYNPLAWSVLAPIRIPISGEKTLRVTDGSGKTYATQTTYIEESIRKIPSRSSIATHEFVFVANIPALGFKSFYVQKKKTGKRHRRDADVSRSKDEYNVVSGSEAACDDPMVVQRYDDELGDEGVSSISRSASTSLRTVTSGGKTYELSGTVGYYPGYLGNNMVYANRSSGAYIFRPNAISATILSILNKTDVTGNVFQEQRFVMSGNAEYTQRTYTVLEYSEVDWLIGPISDEDGVGKEYVMKYISNILNNGEFDTDSSGRTTLKRKLNQRPQWNLTLEEPVAGNYYPIVGYISIKDSESNLSLRIIPDRPEGGASLVEGEIEMMLHRRLLHDDAFGVGEALNETYNGRGLVVRGTNRIYYSDAKFAFKDVLDTRNKPEVFVTDARGITLEEFKALNTEKSWIGNLANGVHLLTLEPWNEGELLLRLENYLDKSEGSTKQIDLSNFMSGFKVKSVQEMLLSADKLKSNHNQWVWSVADQFAADINKEYGSFRKTARAVDRVKMADDGNKINLDAKEIRTFVVKYELD